MAIGIFTAVRLYRSRTAVLARLARVVPVVAGASVCAGHRWPADNRLPLGNLPCGEHAGGTQRLWPVAVAPWPRCELINVNTDAIQNVGGDTTGEGLLSMRTKSFKNWWEA